MVSEPEYAQNIVVGVRFHDNFAWYITEKEYWYLDYTKYNRALLAGGHARLIVSDDFAERFHIALLDEHTAESFLLSIVDKRVLASTLSQMMVERRRHEEQDDLLDFAPCLLVDFDQRQFFLSILK